ISRTFVADDLTFAHVTDKSVVINFRPGLGLPGQIWVLPDLYAFPPVAPLDAGDVLEYIVMDLCPYGKNIFGKIHGVLRIPTFFLFDGSIGSVGVFPAKSPDVYLDQYRILNVFKMVVTNFIVYTVTRQRNHIR